MSGFVDKEKLQRYTNGIKEKFALKTDIVASDWDQNDSTAADFIKNKICYVEAVGTDYKSDMEFLQLFSGVNTDDGGQMDYFDYGYARFDVVNQDIDSFSGRQFSRGEGTEYQAEGDITWHDETETGWYELYDNDNNLIAILVTDDYVYESPYFSTVDENMRPVDYETTPGLYVLNSIYGSVSEGSLQGIFDFLINHKIVYHTIDKNYLPPVEWNEIENRTHGVFDTATDKTIVDHDDFTDDTVYCTATFEDPVTTCYRNFILKYDDDYTEEWYGYLLMRKSGETEFIDCSDGMPQIESGDLLIFGNPYIYDNTLQDNGDNYVVYNVYNTSNPSEWTIKIDSDFTMLDYVVELEITDIYYLKKLDKIYLPNNIGGGSQPVSTSGVSYIKSEKDSDSYITLNHSEYTVITVTDDFELALESENISDGDTIYEYNGELIFGNTVYSITWPLSITSIIGASTFSANSSYLFSILNDTIIITQK